MKLKKVKTGIFNFFCNKDTVSNLYWKTSILADYKYETFFSESFRRTKYKALFHPITQYRLFSKWGGGGGEKKPPNCLERGK